MRTSIILSQKDFEVVSEIELAILKGSGAHVSKSAIIRGLVQGFDKKSDLFAACKNQEEISEIVVKKI